jgi:bifunctional DNA-binding transcriptional regulator/antitoxin component of YhaV-PrlF toxin-antitoxin module
MWHTFDMAHKRFTVHLGERGRLVIPVEVRRSMGVTRGDLLAIDLDENGGMFEVRTAADVARSARGVLRHLAPGHDLTTELIEDRREEAERETAADERVAGR